MKKILLSSGIVLMLLSVAWLIAVARYPPPFTESILCPNGMTIDGETIVRNRSRRNSTVACRNEAGETVDVTGKMLLMFSVPFSTGLVMLILGCRKSQPQKATSRRVIIINFKAEK